VNIRSPQRKIALRICPCGSGKPVVNCHLDIDGQLRKRLKSLKPPVPQTGFAHPSCYLSETRDCSREISREHYISRSVLEQLGSTLRAMGMPWLDNGQALETKVDNLTAKILCRRHNEALSPLDQEAAHFFSVIRKALIDLKRNTLSRKPIFHLVCGDAIELWMLKVACGQYFAVGSKERICLCETHTIDLARVRRAFLGFHWDLRGGLYFAGGVGSRVDIKDEISVFPLIDDAEHRFCGTRIFLHGFGLKCLFDARTTNPGPEIGLFKRPTELVLKRREREHHIILTWPPGTPQRSITLEEFGIAPL
jgi:hypothetical protein